MNVFKSQPKSMAQVKKVKGQEIYPQPFKREKLKERRKSSRYKTLPVTLEELSQIPELEPLKLARSRQSQKTLVPSDVKSKQTVVPSSVKTQNLTVMQQRPSQNVLKSSGKTVSDSDSDFDKLVEVNYMTLTGDAAPPPGSSETNQRPPSEEELKSEDEKSKMSLSEKMLMFKKLEEESKKAPMTPRTGRRFLDRKKRLERSKTQPVTDEELTKASILAKAEGAGQEGQEKEVSQEVTVEQPDQPEQDVVRSEPVPPEEADRKSVV